MCSRARRSTLAALAIATLATALPGSASAQAAAEDRTDLGPEEARLLDLVNAYRARHHAPPLVDIPILNGVAYDHSRDMARRRFFAHENPDGLSPFDRMERGGYMALAMGENLAAGFDDAEHTFEQWRTSPSHNAAMLDPEYRGVGIGRVYAPGTSSVVYWTMDMGDLAPDVALDPEPLDGVAPGPEARTPRAPQRAAHPAPANGSSRTRTPAPHARHHRARAASRRTAVATINCPRADRP